MGEKQNEPSEEENLAGLEAINRELSSRAEAIDSPQWC